MIVRRVEKHIIKKSNPYYLMIDEFCFQAKNLYNHANYLVRQIFCEEAKWLRYNDLDKLLKSDIEYPDYKNMPTAQSAQQILRLLDKNWTSFFKSIKDWSKHKDKYLGRPKLPKYKAKDGRYILILTNQNVRIKNNILYFPKSFNGFTQKVVCVNKPNFKSFQQVRFIPKYDYIVMEVIYNVEITDTEVKDNQRYLSIDIGVDNLATVTNNFGEIPFIINGKGLKSVNKYYNKQISHYREIAKRMNDLDYTHRMSSWTTKRNNIINNYIHNTSRYIVNYAIENNVSAIVIGKNNNWKQGSNMNKLANQTFVQIPFAKLIQMITYKAEEVGISVITTEESYTSGTSFLDNETPTKEQYNKSRRVHRGLFKSNNGKLINADVNGSLQILKKVFPKAYTDGIEAVALQPVVVNACSI